MNPIHFPAAFPEVFDGENSGFDVIIGNPPWEKTKIERDVFWRMKFPGLYGSSQAEVERRIKKIRSENPRLVDEFERRKK
jgi:hypothetical protein